MRKATMPLARYQALSEMLPKLNRLLREESFLNNNRLKRDKRDKVYTGAGIVTAAMGSGAAYLGGYHDLILPSLLFGLVVLPIGMSEIDFEWNWKKMGKLGDHSTERQAAIQQMQERLTKLPDNGKAYTLTHRERRMLNRSARKTLRLAQELQTSGQTDRLVESILDAYPDVTKEGPIRRTVKKISPKGRAQGEGRARA